MSTVVDGIVVVVVGIWVVFAATIIATFRCIPIKMGMITSVIITRLPSTYTHI